MRKRFATHNYEENILLIYNTMQIKRCVIMQQQTKGNIKHCHNRPKKGKKKDKKEKSGEGVKKANKMPVGVETIKK